MSEAALLYIHQLHTKNSINCTEKEEEDNYGFKDT